LGCHDPTCHRLFFGNSTTEKLARAIERGTSPIAEVTLCRITGQEIISGRFQDERTMQTIDAAGVAFGSPTYMGGASEQFKAFADASSERWSEQLWAGKAVAGFTTGVCAGGDQLHTLTYFSILAAQHGMPWCGLDIPGGESPNGLNRLGPNWELPRTWSMVLSRWPRRAKSDEWRALALH
jgi:multimeric flavodoxin WrbA